LRSAAGHATKPESQFRGRRATTHWDYVELLPLVGATHEKRRVVRDGNLITAGGVTSGIDFGLEVVADIAGEAVARLGSPGMTRRG
jgi:cyclohexyl-isocyanide hydratase